MAITAVSLYTYIAQSTKLSLNSRKETIDPNQLQYHYYSLLHYPVHIPITPNHCTNVLSEEN